ncbi:hypothetical protein ACFVFS_20125 [Kitasatospora sp. NPDC057692]|uniref:hypothetical protein n=1 Tax=Kitasatospora sp. NPDC057692 TaxID=3346215 RepID=UPI0036788A71
MKMTDPYRKALAGTLKSTTHGLPPMDLAFTNNTEIPLSLYLISDEGCWLGRSVSGYFLAGYPAPLIPPGTSWGTLGGVDPDWYFLFLNTYTGAFVAVRRAASAVVVNNANVIIVTCADLLDPNSIGPVPMPNRSVVIPPDSPRVAVGCGKLPATGNTVIREQYWQRLPDSYSIAAGARRTVSYTVTAGMESTSSERTQLASSVTGSATAGWGPISASVSASLSANATNFQQITTSLETTSFVSQDYDNTGGTSARMFLYWQLTNVLTLFDPTWKPLTSLIYGSEGPAVVSTPADPAELPPRPLERRLPVSPAMRARLAEVAYLPPGAGPGPDGADGHHPAVRAAERRGGGAR